MPGLFGYVGFSKKKDGDILKNMAQALGPIDRGLVDLYQRDDVGLGRLSLGIINLEPQPFFTNGKNQCVILDGEFYDTRVLRNNLIAKGYIFQGESDPELVLHLYQEYGIHFAEKLNGAFVLAIWDFNEHKLILTNDRLGLYPLYYAFYDRFFSFASGARALMVDPNLPRNIDPIAMAQFVTFDHALGDRTFLSSVKLLPPASVLTFSDEQINISFYWKASYSDTYSLLDREEYIEGFLYYLCQAVSRQSPGDLVGGLLLSGGLDSRFLLPFLQDESYDKPFHTFTWGIPGCDDARAAKELANKVGTRHHFLELQPDWLLGLAKESVRLTDGLGNIVNLHAMVTLENDVPSAQVFYKGFLGDTLMGYALLPTFWANYDEGTRHQAHLTVQATKGQCFYDQAEQKKLFTESFYQNIGEEVFNSYQNIIDQSGNKMLANQRQYFDLTQRARRCALNGVEVVRNKYLVRLPYSDKDLVEFSMKIPPGYLHEKSLMGLAFSQNFPELAKTPLASTGLPMISCAREVFLRAANLLQWHLDKRGIHWTQLSTRRPYKDYNNWFRTILRPWVEGILLDEQSLGRGYFQPEYVQNMVAEHMAGNDYTTKLGSLLTLELWHREFID